MFIKNKYYRWYYQIIDKARKRGVSRSGFTNNVYYEKHHITPRSLGGSDAFWNVTYLTYKEHILAHWILTKILTGKARMKMLSALSYMTAINADNKEGRVPPIWLCVLAMEAARIASVGRKVSSETKTKLRVFNLGKKASSETKAKLSVLGSGRKHSEKTKAKLSVLHFGKKYSEETGQKMSKGQIERFKNSPNPRKGKVHTDEAKKIIKEKRKLQIFTEATRRKLSIAFKRIRPSIKPFKGEQNGRSKLTEENVIRIRYFRETEKWSFTKLASEYNVSYQQIKNICEGKQWKHLLSRPIWSTPSTIEVEI